MKFSRSNCPPLALLESLEGALFQGPPCVVSPDLVRETGLLPKGGESPPFQKVLESRTFEFSFTLLTPSLTPNFISFVASVNVFLYPATFSFKIIMSEGISIKPGEMTRFKTTFVFFISNLMSKMAFTGSSCVMVAFTSL